MPDGFNSYRRTVGNQDPPFEVSMPQSRKPGRNGTELLDFEEDSPGEGYGTLENVPGFDPAVTLLDRSGDEDEPPLSDNDLVHADEEWTDRNDGSSYGGDGGHRIAATRSWPWGSICQLVVTRSGGRRLLCTGWLASPRVVVTAGRCVYDPRKGWARQINVIPGLDPSHRRQEQISSQRFQTLEGWRDSQIPACDYGCVILPDNGFARCGAFGLAWMSGPGLADELVNSAGYPASYSGDKPRGTQWFDPCRIEGIQERKLHLYDDRVLPAGSPLWLQTIRNNRTQRLVCGLAGSGRNPNSAIHVNQDVFDVINRWKFIASSST